MNNSNSLLYSSATHNTYESTPGCMKLYTSYSFCRKEDGNRYLTIRELPLIEVLVEVGDVGCVHHVVEPFALAQPRGEILRDSKGKG